MDNFRENKFFALFFQKWDFGNLGIFVQASAKPSLLELCRAQPKNMNAVRNLCKSNAKKLASFAETPPKIMTQFVICASERRAGVINKEAKYHQYTRIFEKKLRFYKK